MIARLLMLPMTLLRIFSCGLAINHFYALMGPHNSDDEKDRLRACLDMSRESHQKWTARLPWK